MPGVCSLNSQLGPVRTVVLWYLMRIRSTLSLRNSNWKVGQPLQLWSLRRMNRNLINGPMLRYKAWCCLILLVQKFGKFIPFKQFRFILCILCVALLVFSWSVYYLINACVFFLIASCHRSPGLAIVSSPHHQSQISSHLWKNVITLLQCECSLRPWAFRLKCAC